jgi:hypothetical protein
MIKGNLTRVNFIIPIQYDNLLFFDSIYDYLKKVKKNTISMRVSYGKPSLTKG